MNSSSEPDTALEARSDQSRITCRDKIIPAALSHILADSSAVILVEGTPSRSRPSVTDGGRPPHNDCGARTCLRQEIFKGSLYSDVSRGSLQYVRVCWRLAHI